MSAPIDPDQLSHPEPLTPSGSVRQRAIGPNRHERTPALADGDTVEHHHRRAVYPQATVIERRHPERSATLEQETSRTQSVRAVALKQSRALTGLKRDDVDAQAVAGAGMDSKEDGTIAVDAGRR